MQGEREFLAEVEVLSKVCHPNIVMLLGCCRSPGQQCIVYEWMANGSLQDRLDLSAGTPPLPWNVRLSIAIDVTRALCFLHGHPGQEITHHDIKPANILLDSRFQAKVSDVGLARIARASAQRPERSGVEEQHAQGRSREGEPPDSYLIGTLAYMDPEYRSTGVFHPCCDIYALGVSLMQLLTAMPPNGLPSIVEKSISTGKLSSLMDISDPRAGQWPLWLLRKLFTLSLRCTAERAARPTLDEVMEELLAMSNTATGRDQACD